MSLIKYRGRSIIIPVFGCGSFGITTTAMSIAYRLGAQAQVLYVDFDMQMSKADSWFRKNPVIKTMPDLAPLGFKATGLGILVEKGLQYFLNNTDQLIQNVSTGRAGKIDYLSGFRTKVNYMGLMGIDFSALLDYLGNNYHYIIIDFGKLGICEESDKIIKAFSDITNKNIVVTTNDKFESTAFRSKLGEVQVQLSSVIWLMNMCLSTKIDEVTKKAISPMSYTLMPYAPSIYGKRAHFTTDNMTRDKLSVLMDMLEKRKQG